MEIGQQHQQLWIQPRHHHDRQLFATPRQPDPFCALAEFIPSLLMLLVTEKLAREGQAAAPGHLGHRPFQSLAAGRPRCLSPSNGS